MRSFTKILKHSGFSLIETMMGVALMAGVGLMVSQLSKQSNDVSKKSLEAASTYEIFNLIQKNFQDRNACKNTLRIVNLLVPDGTRADIPGVNNKHDKRVITTGDRFDFSGSRVPPGGFSFIQLSELFLERLNNESTVQVVLTVSQNGKMRNLKKSIPLNVEYTPTNLAVSCEADMANAEEEAVEAAVNAICKGEGLLYDPIAKKCRVLPQFGTAPEKCTNPQETVVATVINPTTNEYSFTCEDTLKIPLQCNNDQVLTRSQDSTFSCVSMSCSGGGLYQGIENSTVQCFQCGEGQLIHFNSSGALTCSKPSCSASPMPNYFVGLNSNGESSCRPVISAENDTCSNGQLKVMSDGSVKYDCCTPECPNTENTCSDASEPSLNGCGFCRGSKSPKDAEWGTWVNTGATRVKEGAVCSAPCGTGQIAIEKEQKRSCLNNNECGGLACSSAEQQRWDDGGTISCNTHSCITAKWEWETNPTSPCGNNCLRTVKQVCSTGVDADCAALGPPATMEQECSPMNRCCAPGLNASVPAGTIYGEVSPNMNPAGSGHYGGTGGGGPDDKQYCFGYYVLYKCVPGAPNSWSGWISFNTKGDGSKDYSWEYCDIYESGGSCQSRGNHCARLPTYQYCYVSSYNQDSRDKVRRIQYNISETSYYYGYGTPSPMRINDESYGHGITCTSSQPSPAPAELPW